MKKLSLIVCLLALFSCKKDNPDTSSGSNTNNTNTSGVMSATINGTAVNWTIPYTSKSGIARTMGAKPSLSSSQSFSFGFFVPVKTGTYTIEDSFSSNGNTTYCSYYDESGTSFHGLSGTLIITEVDTTSEFGFNKFIGTFNLTTDTVGGKSQVFTNGKINYKKED